MEENQNLNTVIEYLSQYSSLRFSGRLDILTLSRKLWSIFYRKGQVVWCSTELHQNRRWRRVLSQCCPKIEPDQIKIRANEQSSKIWDYYSLNVLLKRQQITPSQTLSIIKGVVGEVLFDLVQQKETSIICEHDAQDILDHPVELTVGIDEVSQNIRTEWESWCKAGLVNISPNLSPQIKESEKLKNEVSAAVYKNLVGLVDGSRTLRDLSVQRHQELPLLVRSLGPFMRKGLVGLVMIPDLPKDFASTATGVSHNPQSPLIACVDDSPQTAKIMEAIVGQAGYQFLSIVDSLYALPKLIENKPDLIFLDLEMPIANGYEICTQLRRVPRFQDTPIIILTGNAGISERLKSKVAGASAFLSKPIDQERVLGTIKKYIQIAKVKQAQSEQLEMRKSEPSFKPV